MTSITRDALLAAVEKLHIPERTNRIEVLTGHARCTTISTFAHEDLLDALDLLGVPHDARADSLVVEPFKVTYTDRDGEPQEIKVEDQ